MYARPRTVEEAVAALAAPRALILCGGTDVFPAHVERPLNRPIVDVSGIAAMRGMCSQMRRSGVRESIGENVPRMFSGASGFMSKVSSWLGPPNRNRKITDLPVTRSGRSLAACNNDESPNPPSPKVPSVRNPRRSS